MESEEIFGYDTPIEALKAVGYSGKGVRVIKTSTRALVENYTHTNMLKPEGCMFWHSFEWINNYGKFSLFFNRQNENFIALKMA